MKTFDGFVRLLCALDCLVLVGEIQAEKC